MLLPDDYLRKLADAVHAVGGLFVLDCIASGTIWVDMEVSGVDVLISAPQKGWSASPCCALVMLSAAGLERLEKTRKAAVSPVIYASGGTSWKPTKTADTPIMPPCQPIR